MAILRRADQPKTLMVPGVERYTLADAQTGARWLKIGDLFWEPGSRCDYHIHPEQDAEETQYIVDGEIEAVYDGRRFTVRAGDAILSPPHVPHGFVNSSGRTCRMITAFPTTSRSTQPVEQGPPGRGALPRTIVFGQNVTPTTPYEGLSRYDIVTAEQGAASTMICRLVFEPGGTIPPHIHPDTEEGLFVVSGELRAVYGEEEDIPLGAGDMCLAEPGVRHGLANRSRAAAQLLALFPTTAPSRLPAT